MGHDVARRSRPGQTSEQTVRELTEAALAHVVGDAAEQAYARGDMLARRMQLMESWCEYCSRPDTANGVVVPLGQGAPA
jgi:hypothetical protein